MDGRLRNHFYELLDGGGVALGAQLRFGSASIAELFAAAGFDFVVIDGEHAPQTPVGIQAQLQAVNGYECTPVVRLGGIDRAGELSSLILDLYLHRYFTDRLALGHSLVLAGYVGGLVLRQPLGVKRCC